MISVIVTVKNEGHSVEALLASLVSQSRCPDEIIVVDGGSSDDTVQRIRGFHSDVCHLVLIEAPGSGIARGRNTAVARARHPIIASTDAGVRLVAGWLKELTDPLLSGSADVVSGFFLADPQTTFEVAMGATVLPERDEVLPERFLPSSRSIAFTREAWQRAGGYPEWLDYCEDLVFDLKLRESGCRFAFAPDAIALFRPRSTLQAFFLQYYRYARGDGKANLWRKRHVIRYATYLIGAPGLIALAVLHHPLWAVTLVVGLAFYTRRPYVRLARYAPRLAASQRLAAAILVPVIRVVGDIAKMCGYPAGVCWRLRHGRGSTVSH